LLQAYSGLGVPAGKNGVRAHQRQVRFYSAAPG
jgi:hypothetical protein